MASFSLYIGFSTSVDSSFSVINQETSHMLLKKDQTNQPTMVIKVHHLKTLTMCEWSSFFARLRSVSLLQGRKDDRCVYSLERNWPPCSRHCNSILNKDNKPTFTLQEKVAQMRPKCFFFNDSPNSTNPY